MPNKKSRKKSRPKSPPGKQRRSTKRRRLPQASQPAKQRSTAHRRSLPVRQLNLRLTPSLQLQIRLRRVRRKPAKKAAHPLISWALSRKVSGSFLMGLGLIGLVYFGFKLWGPAPAPPPVELPLAPQRVVVPSASVPLATYTHSEPTAFRIPSLNINTTFVTVGRAADGTLEVPKTFTQVGWYRDGPTPGEVGPAIIVGHVDSYKGPAIFWRLSQIKPGQIIEIDRADGQTIKFTVTDVKQFEQDNFPSNDVYGNINYAGLRIITCGGTFSHIAHRYSHNTVVFATLT